VGRGVWKKGSIWGRSRLSVVCQGFHNQSGFYLSRIRFFQWAALPYFNGKIADDYIYWRYIH